MDVKLVVPRPSMWALLLGSLVLLLVLVFSPALLLGEKTDPQFSQAVMTIVALVLLLVQFRLQNMRLSRLAEVATAIGSGDYDARSDETATDYLGNLAESVNLMAEKIGVAIGQLERSQAELEATAQTLERQNDELSVAVERQRRFGDFLAEVATMDLGQIAGRSLASVMDLVSFQVGILYLYDRQKGTLEAASTRSLDRSFLSAFDTSGAIDGIPGEAIRRKEWITLGKSELAVLPEIDLGVGKGRLGSVHAIPILFHRKAIGVLVLGGFGELDASTRQVLSNYVEALANVIKNAVNYHSMRRQSVQLEDNNRELLEAHKAKGEFVAKMSHELRTPLNSIIGFSGILEKNRRGNLEEDDLKKVKMIHRNGRDLLDLINDILDVSKLEAGKVQYDLVDTQLTPVLREAVEMLQPQAEAKHIELNLDVDPPDLAAVTDAHKLKQVMVNLVGNAVKFTKEGGVTVKALKLGKGTKQVKVQVIDTGIGIAPDRLEEIFEAFTQADSRTAREFGGTGLGLTISRSFITAMGGTLEVFSAGVGEGSTFTINLPRERAETENGPGEGGGRAGGERGKERDSTTASSAPAKANGGGAAAAPPAERGSAGGGKKEAVPAEAAAEEKPPVEAPGEAEAGGETPVERVGGSGGGSAEAEAS